MQSFSASQPSWFHSKQPLPTLPRPRTGLTPGGKTEICGWYDSSFDLAQGLEVVEQDCDTLYQLWELSQNRP